jgi:hypothetical protein
LNVFGVMADVERRDAPFAEYLFDVIQHTMLERLIHRGERLIEEKELRAA